MTTYKSTLLRSLFGGMGIATFLTAGLCPFAQSQAAHSKKAASHSHAKITAAQAEAVALKKYPGKVEGKINFENEEGSWQYAVNVRSGKTLREVMVDANTGKIANVEVTTKAEETKEQKAEAAHKKHPTGGKSH
ncbi:MAG: PepSY domain-containing protein [Chthonomonadales bacterium]